MKRRVMTQFDQDKVKMEQDHHDSFIHIKDAFDQKIQISKQKREVKNDKLFDAENTC